MEKQIDKRDLEYWIIKARIALRQGDYPLTKKILNQLQKQIKEANDEESFKFHVTQSSYNWAVKDLEKFQQHLQFIDAKFGKFDCPNSKIMEHYYSEFLNNRALIHLINKNFDEALSLQQQSSAINTKIGNISSIASNYNNIAIIYIRQADYSNAMVYLKKARSVFKQINDNKSLASILNNIGGILLTKGNLNSSLEHYEKSLELAEKYNELDLEAKILNNMGNIYLNQGNLQLAKNLYSQSLAIKEELGQEEGLAVTYHNLGKLYRSQGNYGKALGFYNTAHDLLLAKSPLIDITNTLVEKIQLFCEIGNLEVAKSLLSKLEHETLKQEQPLQQLQYKYAKAIILTHSGLNQPQKQALDLFGEIIQGENINFEITISSLIYYIELTIQLQQSSKINPKEDIGEKINSIYKIAQQNSSTILLAEALVLKAKYAYFNGHIDGIEPFIIQAEIIAFEDGLSHLSDKIKKFVEGLGKKESAIKPTYDLIADSLTDMRKVTFRL